MIKADCYQVDKGAAEAGVEGVAGRALRPWLPSLPPDGWPPRRHEGGLEGAGRELAGLPWSVTEEKTLLAQKKRSKTWFEELPKFPAIFSQLNFSIILYSKRSLQNLLNLVRHWQVHFQLWFKLWWHGQSYPFRCEKSYRQIKFFKIFLFIFIMATQLWTA